MPKTLGGFGVQLKKAPSDPAVNSTRAALLTGGFGLLLLLIVSGYMLLNFLYRTQGVEVIGTVQASSPSYDAHQMPHNSISYRFVLADGRTYTGTQSGYSASQGESVLLIYLKGHPSFNRVAGSEQQDKKFLAPLGIAALVFILISLQAYAGGGRKSAQSADMR